MNENIPYVVCVAGNVIDVLKSGAGWYIGTMVDGQPCCRISEEYWATKEEAEKALVDGFNYRMCSENKWCVDRHGGFNCWF